MRPATATTTSVPEASRVGPRATSGPAATPATSVTILSVTVDGDAAVADSVWQFFVDTDNEPRVQLMGTYRDDLVRTTGRLEDGPPPDHDWLIPSEGGRNGKNGSMTPMTRPHPGRFRNWSFDSSERYGDLEALVDGDVTITYAELRGEVDRAARGLMALGVGHGDRVAIWAPNCWEWVVVALGDPRRRRRRRADQHPLQGGGGRVHARRSPGPRCW